VLNVLLTAHVLLATRTVVCNVTDQSNKWLFHVIVPVSLFADMVISEGKGREGRDAKNCCRYQICLLLAHLNAIALSFVCFSVPVSIGR
jgi:hypothetical protein